MDLIATPKNPIPVGATTGYVEVKKGINLRFASWRSALRERRGTVCIFPGRAEFIEKYFEVVGELRRRGFAVAVLDWRGQGGSSRLLNNPLKGHVQNFSLYEADLSRFMNEVVLPDCPPPYYALAHSMGATVLLRAATMRGCWFSRMVLTAPLLEIAELPRFVSQKTVASVAEAVTFFGLGRSAVPGGMREYRENQVFANNPLTSDRERFVRNQSVLNVAPKLALGPPTFGWLNAACDAMAYVGNDGFPARLKVPVLLLAAGDDRVVSNKAIESLAMLLKAGSQLLLRGARHEIMQEQDYIREQFWAAFDAFVPGVALRRAS